MVPTFTYLPGEKQRPCFYLKANCVSATSQWSRELKPRPSGFPSWDLVSIWREIYIFLSHLSCATNHTQDEKKSAKSQLVVNKEKYHRFLFEATFVTTSHQHGRQLGPEKDDNHNKSSHIATAVMSKKSLSLLRAANTKEPFFMSVFTSVRGDDVTNATVGGVVTYFLLVYDKLWLSSLSLLNWN